MLRSEDRAGAARSVWSQTLVEQVQLTEDGLVFGAGSVLACLRKVGSETPIAEADAERLVALLSVAAGRPLPPDAIVPHVSEAVEHWRRGDKALANLRLVVGRLPRLSCAADAWRMAIAEHLLDAGLPPAALMAELWPDACGALAKDYDPEEPRDWRGWWTRGASVAPVVPGKPRPIQVAMNGGPPDEDEKEFQEREHTGLATPEEEAAHGRAIDIAGGLGGAGRISDAEAVLAQIAKSAAEAVGPGRGPVYGTAVHQAFKGQIQILGRADLFTEQSYLNGNAVTYGTPGSIRVDCLLGSPDRPEAIFDLKTGTALLTIRRSEQIRQHLPPETDCPIIEVRP